MAGKPSPAGWDRRMMQVSGLLFDAYGTLFDVHSVVLAGRAITTDPAALSALWRQKQLEYTWLRTLMGRYEDFWAVTESALRFALRRLDIVASEAEIARLMEAYLSLATFPEVTRAFAALAGTPLGILSNGSPDMLDTAVTNAEIGHLLDAVLSVEAVGVYKPHPKVYHLAVDRFGIPAEAIAFQSSNAWDAYAASAFGMRVLWCNRDGQRPERLPGRPDHEIRSLAELPALIGA